MRTDVLDHGFVEIVNVSHQDRQTTALERIHGVPTNMVREAMDLAVVNAARVSFGSSSEYMESRDVGLIRRLMKDHHGTPFEHPQISWRVRAPILALREWHRHRTASISEISARYVEVVEEFYVPAPEDMRTQVGKAADYTFESMADGDTAYYRQMMRDTNENAFRVYKTMVDDGVAKEIARSVLPVATYSEMIWTCNVRNLMSFLSLRNAPNAQREIRFYAEAMEAMWAEVMPVTAAAFVEYGRVKP